MRKFAVIAVTLVTGILIGSLLVGTAFAATPVEQGTPTPVVPGQGSGRGGAMGAMPERMPRGMAGSVRGGMVGDVGMDDEVLTLLGMTREQMIAERQAGKSLVQIAQAKNVTEQQLVETILAARKADLDKLVADGKLTQARADYMLENMEKAITEAVNRTTVGGARGKGNANPANPNDCPAMDDDSTQTPGAGRPDMPGRGGMRGGRGAGGSI